MAETMQPPPNARSFAREETTADEYRAFSPWAFLALGFGLCSWLAFLTPLFWLLPLASVIVGIFTWRFLQANRDRYVGGPMVLAGLAMSLLVLGWAPARQFSRMAVLEAHGRRVAEQFIELVNQGKLQEAHEWHLQASARAPYETDLKTYYAADPNKERVLNEFFNASAFKQWLRMGRSAKAKFVRVSSAFVFSEQEEILFEYLVEGSIDGKPVEQQTFIIIGRDKIEGKNQYELFVVGAVDMDPFLRKN